MGASIILYWQRISPSSADKYKCWHLWGCSLGGYVGHNFLFRKVKLCISLVYLFAYDCKYFIWLQHTHKDFLFFFFSSQILKILSTSLPEVTWNVELHSDGVCAFYLQQVTSGACVLNLLDMSSLDLRIEPSVFQQELSYFLQVARFTLILPATTICDVVHEVLSFILFQWSFNFVMVSANTETAFEYSPDVIGITYSLDLYYHTSLVVFSYCFFFYSLEGVSFILIISLVCVWFITWALFRYDELYVLHLNYYCYSKQE